ncbi:lactonase family protein [Flavivirga abyssicola]|uniref:lactonase family protein n=1 Tax=Flavivirga abyssicola TaxID=3063533 RepID=UPI0026E034FC|nr:lactonase family protein [Flavivirga sp. MEBiC07777]WVK11982.1 lactonase family protein [Flavivirga sp. MEBiC07777]
MNSVFYIGCYTHMLTEDFGGKGDGIYTVEINNNSGVLKVLHTFSITNPAYLTLSDDQHYLYALTEVSINENPKVKAFKIQEDYSLQLLNEQAIDGDLPCHITYMNNGLLIACYGSGNMLLFPTKDNGTLLPSVQNFQHTGSSINLLRQEGPHAHQTMIHPNGKDVFVPDLGIDLIKAYRLENNILVDVKEDDIAVEKGGGPRHMVFNKKGDLGYLINELTGDVSILKRKDNKFTLLKSVRSLPSTFSETPSGSALRIHPNGNYLYVGNRTLDAITIFKIQGDNLELQSFQSTNGKTLREFNIISDGKWLIACLQDSNEVITYKIAPNGELLEQARNYDIVSAVCVTSEIK